MKIVERFADKTLEGMCGPIILDIRGAILCGGGEETLREAILKNADQGRKDIILNLADVPYVDVQGLGAIIGSLTMVSKRGGRLKLLHLTMKMVALFSITKLLTHFETYDNGAEAVRSFGQEACPPPPAAA